MILLLHRLRHVVHSLSGRATRARDCETTRLQHKLQESVFGQRGVTLPAHVYSRRLAAQHAVQQRCLVPLPHVLHLLEHLVEGVGDLQHVFGSRHLAEEALEVLGQDLAWEERETSNSVVIGVKDNNQGKWW